MYVAHCISIRSSIETFLKLIDVHTLSFSRQAGGGEVFEGNEYSKKTRRHNTRPHPTKDSRETHPTKHSAVSVAATTAAVVQVATVLRQLPLPVFPALPEPQQ